MDDETNVGLTLCHGGKLVDTRWSAKREKYVPRDVTRRAVAYLFDPCRLTPDVRLRDVFLLLKTNLPVFRAVLGNWCQEYTEEALAGRGKPYTGKYDPNGIEYLELSKALEIEKLRIRGVGKWPPRADVRIHLGGVGFVLRKANRQQFQKKGQRVAWGVSMSNTRDLVNLPLRLNPKLEVYESLPVLKRRKSGEWKLGTYENPSFTLGEILHGVLWELSFSGPPRERDEFSAELKKRVDEVHSGKVRTVPWSELKKSLGARRKKARKKRP